MSESALGKATDCSTASDKELTCEYCGDTVSHPSHLPRHKRLKHADKLDDTCPTCGEVFSSERGVKLHHKRTHGETLAVTTSTCKQCGESFEHRDRRNPHTCSIECRDKWQSGENASNWRGGKITLTCEWCDEEFRVNPNKSHRRFCGDPCASSWHSEQITGEDNPSWNGGQVRYYGPTWERQKKRARKRDQYRCQHCRTTVAELGKNPSVHHITPFREFDDSERANRLDNLITLCEPCHRKWEGLYLRPDTRGADE